MRFYADSDYGPENSPGYLAKRIFRLSAAGLEPRLEAEGVSYLQWSALVSIFFGFGTTNAALARHIGHDAGATTRLLDGMETSGWVTRTRDAGDRRVVNLALTAEGERIALAGRAVCSQWWNERLAGWDRAEAEALVRMLQRLHRELEQCA